MVHPKNAFLLLALAASLMASEAGAAPASPFVAVGGGVFDGPGNEVVAEQLLSAATGPLLFTTGTAPSAFGEFRAAYGSNGLAIQVTGGINRAVYGGSIWTDGLTVFGGTGAGSLPFSTHLQGSVSGQAELGYALYVSSQPFDLQVIDAAVEATGGFAGLQLPNATRVLYSGVANRCGLSNPIGDCGSVPFQNFQGALDVMLNANVPFVYGQAFYVASLLAGGVDILGGSESFLNSADFSLVAPAGASLQALSGTSYAAVTAVPEPATVWLWAAGLLGLVLRLRRRG